MGFSDKMCYEVAKQVINDIFWKKYKITIKENNTWYENLNTFLVLEWDILQEIEDNPSEFTDNEEFMITRDAMNILLDKLNVDDDEFEIYEQEVDWLRFDDIIGYYIRMI